jgi:hypothetical protein
MGVLSDIIIAAPSEAQAAGDAAGRQDQLWPILEWRGIAHLELERLYAAIHPTAPVPSIGKDCLLYAASEEGPWVYFIPPEFKQAFAAVDPAVRETLASAVGWPVESVAELASHAQQAVASGKELLLILSL